MRRIKSVFLVGLMASGQLSGCSDRDATTLPAEPEAAAPPAQDLLRRGGLITFDAPGAIGTFALDINDAGAIVGRYKTGDGVVHGFLRPRSGAIVTIDVPGSSFTTAKGINTGGDIVGQYGVPEDPNVVHGFLLQNGKFTRLDAPGSTFTNAIGINDRGDITGRFEAEDQQFHGFRLRRGTFTTFDFPGAKDTQLYRSNDAGMRRWSSGVSLGIRRSGSSAGSPTGSEPSGSRRAARWPCILCALTRAIAAATAPRSC